MNARIGKDIRLIALPVALGIAAMALVSGTNQFWCLLAWVIACAILVATGFAGELVPNGLAFSLTMPVPRHRLWREKMFVLGGGLLALTLALLLVDLRLGPVQNVRSTAAWFLLTFPLFAFGGGAALSLWTRQPIATIWLLLLVLGLVFVLTEWLVPLVIPSVYPGSIFEWIVVGLAVCGGYLGRRQFLNFEDDQSETSFQVLDFGRLFARPTVVERPATTSSVLPVLLRKELALQQINFVIAIASVLFITVSGVAVLKSGNEWMGYVSMLTKMIALFVAFSVGAVAFSEEHVIGTAVLNMTLPATRRMQFLVKSMVTLACGALLAGGGMLVIDWLVAAIAPNREFSPVYELRSSYVFLLCLVTPFMATLAGAFASSFSRTFLTSLSGTFVLGMALWGGYQLDAVWGMRLVGTPWYSSYADATNNGLLFLTGTPILAAILAWRSWQNFSKDMLAGNARFKSARAVLVGVVCVFGLNLFCNGRLWELAEPVPTDPQFGRAPKSSVLARPVLSTRGDLAISLDGSLWEMGRRFTNPELGWFPGAPQQIGDDHDWMYFVENNGGFFALKKDGTLWACGRAAEGGSGYLPAEEANRLRGGAADIHGFLRQPVPVFPERRWKTLAGGMSRVETVGIRDDGTMWMWGSPELNTVHKRHDEPDLDFHNPGGNLVQIGADHDWQAVVQSRGVYVCLKQDGTVWIWGSGYRSDFEKGDSQPSLIPTRLPLDTRISSIFRASGGSAIVMRPTKGPAIVYGLGVDLVRVEGVPSELDLIPVEWPFRSDFKMKQIPNRKLYLTKDDMLLEEASDGYRDERAARGPNWVALSELGGFTRDGSYWSRHESWFSQPYSVGDMIVQWLGLTYAGNQPHLIPPRWRVKRYQLRE